MKDYGHLMSLAILIVLLNGFMTSGVVNHRPVIDSKIDSLMSRISLIEMAIHDISKSRKDTVVFNSIVKLEQPQILAATEKAKPERYETPISAAAVVPATKRTKPANAAEQKQLDYIDQWKRTAIYEMKKFGIPASIKLAQGIFESASGQSRLATEGNNHFGIKKYGKSVIYGSALKDHIDGVVYVKDDCGNKACTFIKFDRAWASWRAHSILLAKSKTYEKARAVPITDYKNWAKELKKAGYATGKDYEKNIINIIEKYHLYHYDQIMVQ